MKTLVAILYLGLFYLAFAKCSSKDVPGDLAGDEYVRGRLLLQDNFAQQAIGTPLAKKRVLLFYADSPDELNHLTVATTDDQGYFVFNRLRADKEYKFYYEEKIGELYYTGKITSFAPNNTLLVAVYPNVNKQNGIHVTITDETGSPVRNAAVCIFSNISAYAGGTCDGNTYSLPTDEYGRAFKFNIPPTTYYVRATFKFGNTTLSALDTLQVGKVVERSQLNLRFAPASNGVNYLVLDTAGAKVPGVSVCFFSSPQTYSTDSCQWSSFQAISDINGIAGKQAVPHGIYYVYGVIGSGNTYFVGRDTINIVSDVLKDTLHLKRK